MFTINHNQLVSPLDHAKNVTCSSLLFFIPSLYAFIKGENLMSVSIFLAGLMSANYWRYPTYSWRRVADHISAKSAFVVVFTKGFYIYPAFLPLKLIGLGFVLYCYYMSDKYCNCNIHINNMDPCWWKYHVGFHVCCVGTNILIIWCI